MVSTSIRSDATGTGEGRVWACFRDLISFLMHEVEQNVYLAGWSPALSSGRGVKINGVLFLPITSKTDAFVVRDDK